MCNLTFIIKKYSAMYYIEEYKLKYLFNKIIEYYKCCDGEVCLHKSIKFPILRKLNNCELETINNLISA